jgi:hypothetical protein
MPEGTMLPTVECIYAEPGAIAVRTCVAGGACIRGGAGGSPASAARVCTTVIISGPCIINWNVTKVLSYGQLAPEPLKSCNVVQCKHGPAGAGNMITRKLGGGVTGCRLVVSGMGMTLFERRR